MTDLTRRRFLTGAPVVVAGVAAAVVGLVLSKETVSGPIWWGKKSWFFDDYAIRFRSSSIEVMTYVPKEPFIGSEFVTPDEMNRSLLRSVKMVGRLND